MVVMAVRQFGGRIEISMMRMQVIINIVVEGIVDFFTSVTHSMDMGRYKLKYKLVAFYQATAVYKYYNSAHCAAIITFY